MNLAIPKELLILFAVCRKNKQINDNVLYLLVNSFKPFELKRKLGVFCPVKGFF